MDCCIALAAPRRRRTEAFKQIDRLVCTLLRGGECHSFVLIDLAIAGQDRLKPAEAVPPGLELAGSVRLLLQLLAMGAFVGA